MARPNAHPFRFVIVTLAAITGFAAAGVLVAARAPGANATLTSAHALTASSAKITIVAGACAGGGTEFCFKPESVTVAVGVPVVWTNQTGFNHTTTSCTAAACPGAPANTGSNTFNNPIGSAPGSTGTFTFTSAGTYTYYCMIHGYTAMHGTIHVTAGVTPKVSKFTPTSGRTGTKVTITGRNLAGATSVTFNGTTAVITSDTATKIVVKVPAGATSGRIAVTTAGGTVMSAGSFTVT